MVEWARLPGRSHRVVWVSSTAVFGTHQDGVLDEHSTPAPDHWRGEIVLEAEAQIAESDVPHNILRCSGLYTSKSLLRFLDPEVRARLNLHAVSNRFHRDDAVNWLQALIRAHFNGHPMPSLVHGVDECPLYYGDILRFCDGEHTALSAATTGRRIACRYRDHLPELLYPSIGSLEVR
jgi:nucleoside-diphosphate-sugar epimerase